MHVLGLDPSLTHTAGYHAGGFPAVVENPVIARETDICPTVAQSAGGLRASRENSEIATPFRPFAITTKPHSHAHPLLRLRAIRDAFVRELETCEASARSAGDASPRGPSDEKGAQIVSTPGLLFTEGYAFGARNGREALGELGGMLRLVAFERGWTVVVVPPTVLKAYVTGKGVAPKETMMLECFKRWGYSPTDNNDCDAYCLMRLGMDWCAFNDFSGASPEKSNLPKRVTALLAKLEAWGPAVVKENFTTAPKRRRSTRATAALDLPIG